MGILQSISLKDLKQKITTKKPNDQQIEVAIISMSNCIKHSEDTDNFDELLSNSKEVLNG